MTRIMHMIVNMTAFLMLIDDAVEGSDWMSMILKLSASLKVRVN